jgi:predicted permease
MEQVDLGFDPRGLAQASIELPRGAPREVWAGTFADVLAGVRALPGVEGAELASSAPPDFGVSVGELETEGRKPPTPMKVQGFNAVQPGFFHLARISLRGRTFTGDTTGQAAGPDEVIVNEALARRLWPSGDAVGRRLRAGPKAPWLTVVGVAHDVVAPGQRGDRFDLQLYRPAMTGFPGTTIMLRTAMPFDALLPALRRVAARVDPRLEVVRTRTSETEIAALLAGPRFAMALVGALAFTALVLSTVGLYGVIAYAVTHRMREIGVRVALGAEPRDVARLVVLDGALLAVAGLAIGLGAAALAGRAIQSFLYGVTSMDLPTYAAIALLFGGVGLVASFLPAQRAMRVDPVMVLNAD